MSVTRRAAAVVLAVMLAAALAACGDKGGDTPKLDPKVAPPVIGKAGVLRAGLDVGYVPFCGTVKGGGYAGLDVDLAAAVAERLGLRLQIVDVKPAEMGSALASGTVDIVLGGTPMSEAVLASVSSAGSYLIDGPAIYSRSATASVDATIPISALSGLRVAVQKESEAYWTFEFDYGEGFALAYPTLKEAFQAVERGEADVVVGTASVCAYIARDFDGFGYAGQFGPGNPIGIAVGKDATELGQQVRTQLDALSADGTLASIIKQWLGSFPILQVTPTP